MKKYNLKNIKYSGFKTPQDYFETFEASVLNQDKIKCSGSGFKVPQGYFETIEDTILNKVHQKDNKVIQLFNKKTIITSLSIAASILLLFNLSIFKKQITFDSLDNETLENFVLNEDLESSDIANLITNTDELSSTAIAESVSDILLEDFLLNTEDVEDFLSE
ncbi:hypothetical protein RXV94_09835 [Yeosuana sp. MJ-SS3]|uniref:Uncharacterized protein n=1 Tax=Gilvirhabdus luticola TaxID=3079858 RepID=A0ABU3U7T7_9FLAO|nr:hypothetical protein [Yeosuana sp. MJ-SS3]MDU8886460.1 hypothetical protein [Yeosuana sp. MJ-SS3]